MNFESYWTVVLLVICTLRIRQDPLTESLGEKRRVACSWWIFSLPLIALLKPDAAKIIANLIVLGSGVVLRAVSQAYRQAIVNASKSGVAQETVQNMVHKSSKTMTLQEARQILGVNENTPWEEVLKKYDNLFERNAKQGSFYLQSKVHRAKECLVAARHETHQESA